MGHTKGRGVAAIFIIVVTMFVLFCVFAYFTAKTFNGIGSDTFSDDSAQIAVVEVEGVILKSKSIIERLERAEKDEKIKGIVLRINSPGGAVGPTQEIYEEIIRIDKKKPIVASFESVAASGGYYLGAATRKIYSNPGSITGSIGVIMQFMDMSKLYEFARVKPKNIKAGRYKDVGSSARSMTEEEESLMNDMIGRVHKQFIKDILKRRSKKIKGDINELAQGQIFSGEDALGHGLVDKLGSLWAAGRDLHKELKLKGEFSFKYVKEKKKVRFIDFVESLDGLLSKVNNILNQSSEAKLMYKW